jgi:hypothetical protein
VLFFQANEIKDDEIAEAIDNDKFNIASFVLINHLLAMCINARHVYNQ